MEKREDSYTVGGNENWYSDYGGQYGPSLKIKKKNRAINPIPGHMPKKTVIQKDTRTIMFIEALFTIVSMEAT